MSSIYAWLSRFPFPKNTRHDKDPLSLAARVLRAAIHMPQCRSCGTRAGNPDEDQELIENLTGAFISESEVDNCTTYGEPRQFFGGNMGDLHALRHNKSRFMDYVHHTPHCFLRHRMNHTLLSCYSNVVVKVRVQSRQNAHDGSFNHQCYT